MTRGSPTPAGSAQAESAWPAESRPGIGLAAVPVTAIEVSAFTIPTDAPEADGTLAWDSTTIVVVEARAAGEWGSATPTPTARPRR